MVLDMKKLPPASTDELLHRSGLRRTPVRIGVLRILGQSDHPLDVPTIVGQLPEQTDAVTVYRTLNTFTRKKLVHRVRGEERSWRYALGQPEDKRAHRHPHFVCDDCGKVDCLNEATIPEGLVRSLGISRGYSTSYAEVVLHGQCPKCR